MELSLQGAVALWQRRTGADRGGQRQLWSAQRLARLGDSGGAVVARSTFRRNAAGRAGGAAERQSRRVAGGCVARRQAAASRAAGAAALGPPLHVTCRKLVCSDNALRCPVAFRIARVAREIEHHFFWSLFGRQTHSFRSQTESLIRGTKTLQQERLSILTNTHLQTSVFLVSFVRARLNRLRPTFGNTQQWH
jgi:hypothetical protein